MSVKLAVPVTMQTAHVRKVCPSEKSAGISSFNDNRIYVSN